jgi:Predicted endonuclease containing a URI domain
VKSPPLNPAPSTGTWSLYVLECQGGVLYTGIAKDVDARFAAHLNGTGAIFTRLNPPLRIVAKATLATRGDALRDLSAILSAVRARLVYTHNPVDFSHPSCFA